MEKSHTTKMSFSRRYHQSLQNLKPFRCSSSKLVLPKAYYSCFHIWVLISDVSLSSSHPLDSASFLSFTTFAWMTPMMWRIFRKKEDESSLQLSPHDGAKSTSERSVLFVYFWYMLPKDSLLRFPPPNNSNQLLCRLRRLWEDEVAKVGLEKASLVRVILRFQRTRMIFSTLVGALAMVAVFTGPVINFSFIEQS